MANVLEMAQAALWAKGIHLGKLNSDNRPVAAILGEAVLCRPDMPGRSQTTGSRRTRDILKVKSTNSSSAITCVQTSHCGAALCTGPAARCARPSVQPTAKCTTTMKGETTK